jgi:acyl-CoA thioester hydrolase
VSYRLPARYDDLLDLEVSLGEVRRASARFEYRLLRDGTLLATGHTVHACVDLEGRLRRLPAELRARLGDGEAAPEGAAGAARPGPSREDP